MESTSKRPVPEVFFEAAPDALLVVDAAGRVVNVNARLLRLLRVEGEDVLGQPLQALVTSPPGDQPVWTTGVRRSDGVTVPCEVASATVEVGGAPLTLHSLRDVAERRRRNERVEFLSTHDALTGLGNRGAFDEAVTRLETDGPWPVGVLMVDVDGLKVVNDALGHLAGDALLKRMAQLLRDTFRGTDLVARLGGDEFCVLAAAQDAHAVDLLQQRLERAGAVHREQVPQPELRFSVGSAVAVQGQSLREAIARADERMYAMKAEHRAAHC